MGGAKEYSRGLEYEPWRPDLNVGVQWRQRESVAENQR